MTNRGKILNNNRQVNNNNNNNNKSQNDDDNCSVICYKDSEDNHVGVVRIRQQAVCSACNLMRGTLSLYSKHILENNHRENVKKLCDENRFVPSVYDQAIHLAFHNNFYYQSEKFHFLYKHTNEESDLLAQQTESSTVINESGIEKMEINNTQQKTTPTNLRKRRNLQVTLVFQDKTYSQIGTATAQIREQLLKDMITDRANDIAALPMEIYYTKKKIAPDNVHHNAQKSSVVLTMAKDQSQVMLKKQQQEPFENGDMSSAKNSREDNGVEQNTAITTPEISTAENIDVDDVMNVCKDVLNNIILDIYSKSGELKREQQFLSGIARRSFKKKNTFICDICSIFLTSEKYCTQHLNGSDHLEKVRCYQTNFLPWRQAMQESIVVSKSMKEIMGNNAYDNYKATMTLYLAPNSLSNRGRFCCAYCELVFTDQWSLEKHLHSVEHKGKQTSSDHKDLVVRFANIVILPTIFKYNGITQLSEIPDDIKNRYQWRCVTRAQLDDDTISFSRNYPFDTVEGATRIVNVKSARKQKSFPAKSSAQNLRNNNIAARNQPARRGGFNRSRGGQFQTSAPPHRGVAVKRPFPATGPPSKRFRPDLNKPFPGPNRGPGPIRNYEMNQYGYDRSVPYNNGNNPWPARYPMDQQQQQYQQQQRQEFFERKNFELRSLASNNNGHYGGRPPHPVSRGNNYEHERQPRFTGGGGGGGYDNQQTNYDSNFIRAVAQAVVDYHPEPKPPSLVGPPHRSNTGPSNELIHHVANNLQRSQQQQQPSMSQVHPQNQRPFGTFGVNNNNTNNNNTNSPFFPPPGNQQQNQMGANGPSVRSYADYRASSSLPTNNTHSSMYPPLQNTQNPMVPQSRTFDEFGLSTLTHGSSNPYGQSGRPPFANEEPRYNNFGHQNQMEQSPQAPWHGSSRGGNNVRGRGRGRGGVGGGHFQPMNKQPGSTFSYSSTNNNNHNNSPMRGRGVGQNVRNFSNRR